MEKRDVFLCHASEDKAIFVRPFAEQLRANAITYWLDEAEIHWGHPINQKVNEGLSAARFFIVFITPAFYQCNFAETELNSAIDRELSDNVTLILPILCIDERLLIHSGWTPAQRSQLREVTSEGSVERGRATHSVCVPPRIETACT